MRKLHFERHYSDRIGWLRAAVLGANDGIVSTASLVVGIAAANVGRAELLIAAIAGLVAGAMSMAAGEYVSVSSQADTERADVEREKRELAADERAEREELAAIYVHRGLDSELAARVAEQLMVPWRHIPAMNLAYPRRIERDRSRQQSLPPPRLRQGHCCRCYSLLSHRYTV
jgi:VIT1/CCC1 family predicted Fe2+/Mn2+ transporter